jgi:hypothetical protein
MVATSALEHYVTLLDHEVLDKEFQKLVDLIGPSLNYADYTGSDEL